MNRIFLLGLPSIAGSRLPAALALLLMAGPAAAQSVLKGTIVRDSGKEPIGGAEISIGPTRSARSDAAGRFALLDLTAGSVTVRVRAVGFKPLAFEAELGAHDTVEVELVLTALPQQLAPLVVHDSAPPRLSGKMEVFERRRRLGSGTFITRGELARWQDQPLSLAVRQTANFRLVARPYDCGGGFAAATGRGGGRPIPCAGLTPIAMPIACYLALFVDGARVWTDGTGQPPPDIDQYRSDGLEGAELYLGPGQLPAELQQTGTSCGALVLWTRTGEPTRR